MIKIVLSYEDNYIDRVEKIKEEFFDDVDYFYVEDYINKNILLDFTNNDIIYILNNSTYNLQLIKEIKDKVYKIINEEFYCKENTKLKIQKELKTNDILVPNIIEYEKVTKYEYPLFFKSVDHAELVLKVYNKNSLDNLLQKFDSKSIYLEESLEDSNSEEYKVYFIKNTIYFDDMYGNFTDNIIEQLCLKIGNILKLELFSIDIIKRNDYYYVIDINPSAGLYKSSKSREALIKEFKCENRG